MSTSISTGRFAAVKSVFPIKFSKFRLSFASLGLTAGLVCAPVQAGEVEVLHYWTSGGEAAAISVLKDLVGDAGHQWKDFAVTGGGGGNANEILRQRVLKGDAPASAQIKGLDIKRWARLGFLQNLDNLAVQERWDSVLPEVVANTMKHQGHYVSTPVNVHRTNWMWINKSILDEVGGKVPQTWQEFESIAKKIQARGYTVVAHGKQSWQDATVFESVALAVGGSDFYREAFVNHNSKAMKGETMSKVFDQYRRLKPFFADNLANDDWNTATAEVINGRAAFQFMGDWAKGEFTAAGKQPNVDYICAPMPGTNGKFLFNIDSLAMFRLSDPQKKAAQQDLVKEIMGETFQVAFNLNKGSIPARTDIRLDRFDQCAKDSMTQFISAAESGDLVPSIAHGMATTSQVQSEFYQVIYDFFNGKEVTSRTAARTLSKKIRYGQLLLK